MTTEIIDHSPAAEFETTIKPDINMLIGYWEERLNDAHHAVHVAQQSLERLYPQRYASTVNNLGSPSGANA